ncbi:Thymus-specific serine protease [Physocladia obscura]|uniref:Thymus-specific serine protease n=1 Tax=Physocladia obscura TaxID=109957 RepID=A0AAD5XF25_9FUNG|nr:Thymus-specific serine protease [Physocladia obscura]
MIIPTNSVGFPSKLSGSISRANGVKSITHIFSDAKVPETVAPPGLRIHDGFFNQTVDHFGSQKGINGSWFNQYYMISDSYYKQGGPVFFFIAGEDVADSSFLTGGVGSILSSLMPRYNGLAVSLEHRFYGANAPNSTGRSVPTADLSPTSLQLLTSEQAIEDMAAFVEQFPRTFPQYNTSNTTKWIAIGGSYPGALSAWFIEKHPTLIHAAHASSAPVLLENNFWRYSYAVDAGMTFESNLIYGNSNACMKGWTTAVKALDSAITSLQSNATALKHFQSFFWLSQITNAYDFAQIVTTVFATTVQYYPQDDLFYSTAAVADDGTPNNVTLLAVACSGKYFPAFVDPASSESILLKTLQNFTIARLKASGISGDSDPAVAIQNTVAITDWSYLGAAEYLWTYQACNEFGYGQVAQPLTAAGLIEDWSVYSQFYNVSAYESDCQVLGLKSNKTAIGGGNYGGLNISTPNIMWVNGQYDPWHWLSNFATAPNPKLQTSFLYENGSHCNDLWGPIKVTGASAAIGGWPHVTQSYEDEFFEKIFAQYDVWIN